MTAARLLADRPARSPGSEAAATEVAALEATGIEVGYGGEPAVRAVDLRLTAGEWLGLIGPNGAGKSSLLKAIAGLVDYRGELRIAGRRPPTGRSRAREWGRLVAYVAQRPILPPGMTVAEYVLLGRTAHLRWLAAEAGRDRAVTAAALDRLELSGFAARPVAELSGGEAQRVTLARAIAQDAPVLLLDEPTSALDLAHQVGVLELVDELRTERGLTVVSAMHDLGGAGRFADRLALLHQGTLVTIGAPTEVLTEPVLSRYYGTPVQVMTDAGGGAVVVPLRRRAEAGAGRGSATRIDLDRP